MIQNCTIEQKSIGLYVKDSEFCRIDNNTVNTLDTGIHIAYSSNCSISNSTINGLNSDNGISIDMEYSSDCNITENKLYLHLTGLRLEFSNNTRILSNRIRGNDQNRGVETNYCKVGQFRFNEINDSYYGADFKYTDDFIVSNNTFFGNLHGGVYFLESKRWEFSNNTVIQSYNYALDVWNQYNSSIRNNIFERSGLGLRGYMEICWRLDFENNINDNRPIGYFWNLTDSTLDVSSYSQVFLANCSNVQILDGNISRSYAGVKLGYCENCTVENTTISDCVLGIRPYFSFNTTVNNCTLYDIFTDAINIYLSENSTLMDCHIYDVAQEMGSRAMIVGHSSFSQVKDNYIHDVIRESIRLDQSHSTNVSRNVIHHCGQAPCTVMSNYPNLTNNTIFAVGSGILLDSSMGGTIHNNTIYHTNTYGIKVEDSTLFDITNNTIFDNPYGITIDGTSFENNIYNNQLGWNNLNNGFDEGGLNIWDDGINSGNSWSNYTGTGTQTIPGSAGSVDNYPILFSDTIDPVVEDLLDYEYEVGGTDNWLEWSLSDQYPSHYEILKDNMSIDTDVWHGYESFGISVDGLELGSYNYTFVAYDAAGRRGVDTVIVDVVDLTPPEIDNPDDIVVDYPIHSRNHWWIASDDYPNKYVILKNGTPEQSDSWVSMNPITIQVGSQPVGVYNYTIIVNDTSGNEVTDTVFLFIRDATYPTIDSPNNVTIEYGCLGKMISWNPSDEFTESYEILKNGSSIKQGLWNSSSEAISLLLDDYLPGTYNFTLIVTDAGGNSVSDSVSAFIKPNESPIILGLTDFQVEGGSAGNQVNWNISDFEIISYQVWRNGSLIDSYSYSWKILNITEDLDGLALGIYNYTIMVLDSAGNSATHIVFVSVVDTTPPSITSVEDMVIEAGSVGEQISWIVSDIYPSHALILLNGTELYSEIWDGSNIIQSLDDHNPGVYNYTLVLNDTSGNPSIDIVIITAEDTTSPIVNSPSDVYYEAGNTGYSISWTLSDPYPGNFTLRLDGIIIESGEWNSSGILHTVDGHDPGSFNYTLVVYDTSMNSAFDTVWVYAIDSTLPEIDSPSDVEYEVGTTGHSITWNPSDMYPGTYDLYLDGALIESESWNGSAIVVNVDGLSEGNHIYLLRVHDQSNNTVEDSVSVLVTTVSGTVTTTTTTTTSTLTGPVIDSTMLIMIGGSFAGIFVFVFLLRFLRRRR
jgi:parallel beta-helix repeat protein